jgi:hypothetical protein
MLSLVARTDGWSSPAGTDGCGSATGVAGATGVLRSALEAMTRASYAANTATPEYRKNAVMTARDMCEGLHVQKSGIPSCHTRATTADQVLRAS